MARMEYEEEDRRQRHPDRPSRVLAREEVRRIHGQLNIPSDVLEHMARRVEKLNLESEEKATSSGSSSASSGEVEQKEERPLKKLAKLRMEGDEELRREDGDRVSSLRGGAMSEEDMEEMDEAEDIFDMELDDMHDMMLAVGMVQKDTRKDSGICMDFDELSEDWEDSSASSLKGRIAS